MTRSGGEVVGTLTTRTGNSRDNFSAEVGHLIPPSKQNPIMSPRWLTARECERLMGFPDDYTDVEGVSYWKRHALCGNSWAVPKFRWIGERIQMVEDVSDD